MFRYHPSNSCYSLTNCAVCLRTVRMSNFPLSWLGLVCISISYESLLPALHLR
jgi:hypothetical protein